MAVLLIAELSGGALAVDATAKALTAAQALGEVTVLVAGGDASAAASEAAKLDGVGKVVAVSDGSLANGLAEPLAALVV
ncbi:MAG: electron transfer flavoprotein subunit alpha/FixB family protein, partial [Pseudomonadota bacterium]